MAEEKHTAFLISEERLEQIKKQVRNKALEDVLNKCFGGFDFNCNLCDVCELILLNVRDTKEMIKQLKETKD